MTIKFSTGFTCSFLYNPNLFITSVEAWSSSLRLGGNVNMSCSKIDQD